MEKMGEAESARRAKKALLWVITIIAAAAMSVAGATKFMAAEMWNGLFTEWGYPRWFKSVVGVLEIAGALATLMPQLATYAATVVCVVMLGAIYTVAANQSDLGFYANTGNLVLFGIIAYARRHDRWRPGG